MKFSATLASLSLLAVSVSAHRLPSRYAAARRGDQFVTGPCTTDSDCQQGCCGFTTGKCAGPAVAQTNGSGGCGFGTAAPNCNVAKALGLSDCVAGAVNGDITSPAIQQVAALVAQLNNLPFTPAAPAAAAPPAAAPPAAAPPAAEAPAAEAPPAANNAGAGAAAGGAGADAQTSLTLDPAVIAKGFADDGQNPPTAGQTASKTTTNNWINFCKLTLPGTPLTDGKQVQGGSCNPTPMGLLPSIEKMPSAKFNFPKNTDSINANVPFNASLNVLNFQTGVFTNAQKTYFSAPQTLNAQGEIIGHTHIVIETLQSIDQITPTDPKKFFFFKGVDDPAQNGIAIAFVAKGVPVGAYRMCSINTSANHSPVVGPIAQHGSFDDCVYFTAK
ncbi:hypothetical protein MIND_00440000 [Mycena indigotica]|uniref:Uncharacterized protein n=1 Tax=Mycena indigotica TaxID=2126181 RepID=A0A8H6SX86_9AGAR|nr:uncharacterized protein MIND_00440000 [Mycena indigotica]KAF7306487.1 hypothetical protein MIND_00440000 [Mycena indigotica]